MASCLTKNVLAFGSTPSGGLSIHLEQRINVVSDIEIQYLIDIFSDNPDLSAQVTALQLFLNDLSFGQNDTGADSTPNFTLSMSKGEIAAFAEKCKDRGVSKLGNAILDEWLPLGIERLHFNCSNTRCHYQLVIVVRMTQLQLVAISSRYRCFYFASLTVLT